MNNDIEAAAARVVNQLGPRQREVVYAKALAMELRDSHQMALQVEAPVPIIYTLASGPRVVVGAERVDILVIHPWPAVIECKIAEVITPEHTAQTQRYAQNLNVADCYAVSFGRSGACQVQRFEGAGERW